jgi:pimeloyl-ACP methyl ester carboxylesterase
MVARRIQWQWEGAIVPLAVDQAGAGPSVVLLPALSSISRRSEMRPLLDQLASDFRVTSVDWPGFGDLPRPRVDWSPDALSAFLIWFLREISPESRMVVAAGHAATYALHQAAFHPDTIGRLVLIAPTWRGPLPTMFSAYHAWFGTICKIFDLPLIGQLLYRLNLSRWVVKKMAREHVYSEPSWLSNERLQSKLAVSHLRGARYSSVRFVTGRLDRVTSRAEFISLARQADKPTLVIYGDETPTRSRIEIEALAELPNVRLERLRKGKLSIHEEFPQEVASAIGRYLAGY